MDLLVNSVKDFIQSQTGEPTYWLAYSGGLDSHVLIHLFARLRADYSLKLRVVYVNHGMSVHAADWAAHCQQVCAALQLDFQQLMLQPDPIETSPEDALRQGRYALLANCLAEHDILLTGHHQDDQAETLLLQLFRGAGVQGLASMPSSKPFAKGQHARPLLNFTRADLLAYAKQHQLQWIEDESNTNQRYTRNFIRHEVLPLLAVRWPTIHKTLARTAQQCAEAQALLATNAAHLLLTVQGSTEQTLAVSKLLQLTEVEQRHVLRAWIYNRGFPLPSAVKLRHIMCDVLMARGDRMPCVAWGNQAEVRRYRDDLFLAEPLLPHDASQIIAWDGVESLVIPGVGRLLAVDTTGLHDLTIRFRQGGETIQLPGRAHRHDLKKLLQAWGVPPWLRDRVPLLYSGDRLVQVIFVSGSDTPHPLLRSDLSHKERGEVLSGIF